MLQTVQGSLEQAKTDNRQLQEQLTIKESACIKVQEEKDEAQRLWEQKLLSAEGAWRTEGESWRQKTDDLLDKIFKAEQVNTLVL